jgi:hypothetical protein
MFPTRVIAGFALEAKQSRSYLRQILPSRCALSNFRIASLQSLLAMTRVSPQGNVIKLSRYSVLFAPRYLPASDPDSYRGEELPRSKKNSFARWLYFVFLGSGSPVEFIPLFAGGARGFAWMYFFNLTTLSPQGLRFGTLRLLQHINY